MTDDTQDMSTTALQVFEDGLLDAWLGREFPVYTNKNRDSLRAMLREHFMRHIQSKTSEDLLPTERWKIAAIITALTLSLFAGVFIMREARQALRSRGLESAAAGLVASCVAVVVLTVTVAYMWRRHVAGVRNESWQYVYFALLRNLFSVWKGKTSDKARELLQSADDDKYVAFLSDALVRYVPKATAPPLPQMPPSRYA